MEMQVTDGGFEHGLMETIANSVPDNKFKNLSSDVHVKEMQAKRKRALELIEAEYINLKNQETGKFDQWYGADWPGEPLRRFRCLSGHKYVIPRGLMEKVNEELGEIQRSGLIDSQGNELVRDSKSKIQTHRFMHVRDVV